MESASNEEREVRAARNQALFRAVNEKISELNEAFGEIIGTFAITCQDVRTHEQVLALNKDEVEAITSVVAGEMRREGRRRFRLDILL